MLIDNPPALGGQTFIEIIPNHLNVMHAARTAFMNPEASAKCKRAIWQKRGLQHL